MKTLLTVAFILGAFLLMMAEAMALATRCGWVVWLGIGLLILSMVVVGCWSLSDTTTNRMGWVSVMIAGLFSLVASWIMWDGAGDLWKVLLALAYVAVSARGILEPDLFEKPALH